MGDTTAIAVKVKYAFVSHSLPSGSGKREVPGVTTDYGGGAAMNVISLHTPVGTEVLSLRAGNRVTLSGLVYTARDEAHLMMEKQGIPFDRYGSSNLPLRPDNS